MRKIVVQAFEDPSRPQGGHAVILLRGVDTMPEGPSIRLRPVEVGDSAEARGLWRGARITPLATRATPLGIELVVGPDVVGHPQLLAGTPVVIEVPEADVRGEFLWPGVAPLAAPRRRHVVVPRQPRQVIAAPAPANDDAETELATNLVTAADHMPLAAESDGNLALSAELTAGAVVVAPAKPPRPLADAPAEAARADDTHDDASGDVIGDADVLAGEAPELTVAALAAASAAPAAATLPPQPNIMQAPTRAGEAHWTPGRRGLFGGNGLLAAVAGSALLLVSAFWLLHAPSKPPADTVARATGSGDDARVPSGGGGNSGPKGNGPAGVGSSAAAVGPAAVAAKPAACDAPTVTTEALAAGRMRLAIKAFCKGGETVHVVYGGADVQHRLDATGALTAVVDGFAGAAEPVEVRFADGGRQSIPFKASDLDRVSKVAVIWKAPVDLDLHAFEYAALPGAKGDVWSGAAGSADAVQKAVAAERRGHGFISTSANAGGLGDHVEVYTFMHADEQASASVGLALDHATRGASPSEATCGKGPLAEVPYSLVVLPRGGAVKRESGIIAAADSGSRLGPEVGFNQSSLPALRIRK